MWWDTSWADSISGRLEEALNQRRTTGKRARVIPILAPGASLDAFASYLPTICDSHVVDDVAVTVNSALVTASYSLQQPQVSAEFSRWRQPLHDKLARVQADCKKDGVDVVFVLNPYGVELDPSETLIPRFVNNGSIAPDTRVHGEFVDATSGLNVLDLWPTFDAAESAPNKQPLFLPYDDHLNEHGRALYARALADYYLRKLPH